MNKKIRTVRRYDEEFKRRVVSLYRQRNQSYAELGEELDVPEATIAGWVTHPRYKEQAHLEKSHVELSEEFKQLKKQLADVMEERDILKKALAIFSVKSDKR